MIKTLFECMTDAAQMPITIHIGGETAARLRRISEIDGRSPEDLALQVVENEAAADHRGDFLRSA